MNEKLKHPTSSGGLRTFCRYLFTTSSDVLPVRHKVRGNQLLCVGMCPDTHTHTRTHTHTHPHTHTNTQMFTLYTLIERHQGHLTVYRTESSVVRITEGSHRYQFHFECLRVSVCVFMYL